MKHRLEIGDDTLGIPAANEKTPAISLGFKICSASLRYIFGDVIFRKPTYKGLIYMAKTSVYAYSPSSGHWVVEFIDPTDDGVCEKAIFCGYRAEAQARRFAFSEYGFSEPVRQSA